MGHWTRVCSQVHSREKVEQILIFDDEHKFSLSSDELLHNCHKFIIRFREYSAHYSLDRTMDSISSLNNCSRIYQVLGLQCFSLNIVDEKKEKKYPSIGRTIYLLVITIIITYINWAYFESINSKTVYAETIQENNLVYVIKVSLAILQVAVGIVTLLSSYFKHSRLQEFFMNSEKISDIYLRELSYRVDYKKFKTHLEIVTVVCVVLFAIYIIIGISLFRNVPLGEFIFGLLFILPLLFHLMMHVRFYFYVATVNFHVKILRSLILRCLEPTLDFVGLRKVITQRNSREVVAWKKVYVLLKDMANDVNDSQGFTVLCLISIIIINITRFGYQLYMITVRTSAVDIRKFK